MRMVVYNVVDNHKWRAVARRGAARAKRLMKTYVSRSPAATTACRCLAAKIPDTLCGDADSAVDADIEEKLGKITMEHMATRNYAVFQIHSGGYLEGMAFWA
jgi:hypothetical protein